MAYDDNFRHDTLQLEGLADVIFIGEADETWPQFLRDWEQGCHKSRYEQHEKTDVTKLPLPRIDLLKVNRYMFGSLQISRGCLFTSKRTGGGGESLRTKLQTRLAPQSPHSASLAT
jgi:radical SAM superfamily enzyme YgiQ (UPF0313 family)